MKNLEDEIRVDGDLKDKTHDDTDLKQKSAEIRDLLPRVNKQDIDEGYPMMAIAMEDGTNCELHGDDSSGYEIRRGGRALKTRFETVDHARMAVEMFNARRRARDTEPQDYIEER